MPIGQLRQVVREHFNRKSHVAHGFDHVERVAELAKYIASQESYDTDEAEIAGLLFMISGGLFRMKKKGMDLRVFP